MKKPPVDYAIAISGVEEGYKDETKIKQTHEGRKEPNRNAKYKTKNTKSSKGFYLNDGVKVFGAVGFISGFCKGQ